MIDKVTELDNKIRNKLARYIKQLTIFAAIFTLIFLISGCWHAVLAARIHDPFFERVAGMSPFAIAITLSVLSIGSIVIFVMLLCLLYNFGSVYHLHFAITAITCLAIAGNVILTAVNLGLTAHHSQDNYKEKLRDLINEYPNDTEVVQWMTSRGCSSADECSASIDSFINYYCTGEMIACGVTLFFSLCSILGIAITVILMGMLPHPPDDPAPGEFDGANLQPSDSTNLEDIQEQQNDDENDMPPVLTGVAEV